MQTNKVPPTPRPSGALNDALAPRAVTDAMVEAALIEHRTSDLDGRALVRAMLAAALGA